jgi:hypothetical protein
MFRHDLNQICEIVVRFSLKSRSLAMRNSIIIFFLFGMSCEGFCDQVISIPAADTYVFNLKTNESHCNSDDLRAGYGPSLGGEFWYSFLSFDLPSSVTGATIQSASLRLHERGGTPFDPTICAYRLTSGFGTGQTKTWQSQPASAKHNHRLPHC